MNHFDKMSPSKARTGPTQANNLRQTLEILPSLNSEQLPKTMECPAMQVQRIKQGDDFRLPNSRMRKVERLDYLGRAPLDTLASQRNPFKGAQNKLHYANGNIGVDACSA